MSGVVSNTQVPFIGDYVKIVASLINKYRPPLISNQETDSEIAKKMIEKSKITINPLQQKYSLFTGRQATSNMKKVNAQEAVLDFPVFSGEYLRSLTFGIYQLKQAKFYSMEHIDSDGGYEINVGKDSQNIIQAKIQSRHISSKSYYLWIQYECADGDDPVKYWYCQCKSGACLVGCCAHIASVLWFLGIQRHVSKELSSKIMPSNILDCETMV